MEQNNSHISMLLSQQYNNCSRFHTKTGRFITKLIGHTYAVHSISFSYDGNALASSDGIMFICWNVKLGNHTANQNTELITNLSTSTLLASGSDKSIRVCDLETGQQKSKMIGHTDYVRCLSFSPDGAALASGSDNNSIRLWDVETGLQQSKLNSLLDSARPVCICFPHDGTKLALSSYDKSIRLWDIKTGQFRLKIRWTYKYSQFSLLLSAVIIQFDFGILVKKLQQQIVSIKYKKMCFVKPVQMLLNSHLVNSLIFLSHDFPNLEKTQSFILSAQSTSIFKGEFINHQGINLQPSFKSKGSVLINDQHFIRKETIQKFKIQKYCNYFGNDEDAMSKRQVFLNQKKESFKKEQNVIGFYQLNLEIGCMSLRITGLCNLDYGGPNPSNASKKKFSFYLGLN